MLDMSVRRIMIDLETMSSEKDAAILSLGAVQFGHGLHPDGSAFFYDKVDPQASEAAGLHVSKSTMEWWDKQDLAVRAEAFSGTRLLSAVLLDFESWCESQFGGKDALQTLELWSKGSDFDLVVLANAYHQVLGYYPFNFRMHRCHRTLEAMMPPGLLSLAKNSIVQTTKHNALSDAKYQAIIANVALSNMQFNVGYGPAVGGM